MGPRVWGLGGIIVLLILGGCLNGSPPSPTAPPTPPPPRFQLTASISGNTLEYSMTYVSGTYPQELWLELSYHADLAISGRNMDGKKILLNPQQGLQGDSYQISGGNSLVKTYDILVTPYYKWSYNEDPVRAQNPITLAYTP